MATGPEDDPAIFRHAVLGFRVDVRVWEILGLRVWGI